MYPINNRTGDTTTSCFCEKLNMCVPCDLSGQHPPCIGHKSSPLADMEAAADHLNSFYVRQCHLLLARSKYLETEQYAYLARELRQSCLFANNSYLQVPSFSFP